MSDIFSHISFAIISSHLYIFLPGIISFLPKEFLLKLFIVKIHWRQVLSAFIYLKMYFIYPHVWILLFDGYQSLDWQVFVCLFVFIHIIHRLLATIVSHETSALIYIAFLPYVIWHFPFTAFKLSLFYFGRLTVMKVGVDFFVFFHLWVHGCWIPLTLKNF